MVLVLSIIALVCTTRVESSLPPGPQARIAPLIAAAVLGWILGMAKGWTWRSAAVALIAGSIGTGVFWVGQAISAALPSSLFVDLPALLGHGFAMVPAILAVSLVGRPGAASLGHLTRLALAVFTGLAGASTYPALALLQIPLALLPVEIYTVAAWSAGRSAPAVRSPFGGAVVGLLLGLGSSLSTLLVLPGLVGAGDAVLDTAILSLIGAGTGWLVVIALRRSGAFGWAILPDVTGSPFPGASLIPPSTSVTEAHVPSATDDGPRIIRREDLR